MYCGITDIVDRWVYTRQGLHKLTKTPTFPVPVFTINRGRTKVWLLSDIEIYEKAHPEVLTEEAKARKLKGYAWAILKGSRERAKQEQGV